MATSSRDGLVRRSAGPAESVGAFWVLSAQDVQSVLPLEVVAPIEEPGAPVSRPPQEGYSGPMRRLLRLLRDQAIPALAVVAFDLAQRRHLVQVLPANPVLDSQYRHLALL